MYQTLAMHNRYFDISVSTQKIHLPMYNIPQGKIHSFHKNVMTHGGCWNLAGYNRDYPTAIDGKMSLATTVFKVHTAKYNGMAADFRSKTGRSTMQD